MTTVNGIRAKVLARRLELNLSQTDVAHQTGVSRKWVSEFEGGKARVELGLVLRLVDSLGLEIKIADGVASSAAAKSKGNGLKKNTNVVHLKKIDLDQVSREYR